MSMSSSADMRPLSEIELTKVKNRKEMERRNNLYRDNTELKQVYGDKKPIVENVILHG